MPELCTEALRQIVRHEADRRNAVCDIETGWSHMDVVLRFTRPLDAQFAQAAAASDAGARYFEYRDPRSGSWETGVVCGREAVVAPGSP